MKTESIEFFLFLCIVNFNNNNRIQIQAGALIVMRRVGRKVNLQSVVEDGGRCCDCCSNGGS